MSNKEIVDLDILISALRRVQDEVATERFQNMGIARHIFRIGAAGHNKIIEDQKKENGRWYLTYGLELTDELNIGEHE